MKKRFSILNRIVIGLTALVILALPYTVRAGPTAGPLVDLTIVNGQVKDQSNHAVVGANISISCNGTNVNTTTDGVGKYYYEFDGSVCPVGTTVTVQATSGSGSGSGSAPVQEVYNDGLVVINLVLVNITVPEFGLITGIFTTLASAGAFLMLKRRIA